MNIEGLVDGEARRAIREDLDDTLVVEAAAGTGKTTELVQRVVSVIERGKGRLSTLVAVTFTEKAAGEMKLRLRTELDRALLARGEGPERERLTLALAELETAKVGTIHALCTELLREHPLGAGVDPGFEVTDNLTARALLERAFDTWFERTLAAPGEGVRRLLARATFDARRSARDQLFFAARSLVETRDFDAPFRRDPLERESAIDALIASLHALVTLGARSFVANDPLRVALARLGDQLTRLPDDHDLREAYLRGLARDRKVFSDRTGRGAWYVPGLARKAVIAARDEAKQQLDRLVLALDADVAACLSRELAPVVAGYEAEKRASGLVDFFDLLLYTRDLLRDVEPVRREVQAAITHLFVDEFQDTDPVQSELLLLMCADDPSERDPYRVRPVPGKLFVVGDPKQSIYRFRRADVALYERIKRHLIGLDARVLALSTSFRSLPAIQSLVNAAFAPLMEGQVERGQAHYVPLAPARPARANQPAIIALPAPKPYGYTRITKRAVNTSLPDAVAAWVDWLLTESRYVVSEDGRDVPVASRHVCLLFRRFRAYGDDTTRDYARALEARSIPHVLSGGRAFHAREEVIAVRAALCAIEWPDDALHVYATLRGPLIALSDEVLLAFKREVGHLHPLGPVPRDEHGEPVLSPRAREVLPALSLLAKLHRARQQRPIAETLGELLHALRAHAGLAIWPSGEQALGNVLRVLDHARSYERAGRGGSFRGFVEWLAQSAEHGESADAPVVEETSDGVRIMTIHAAKGLEFPVVVLCDPTAPTRPEYPSRYIDPARRLWAQPLCESEPVELVERRELVRDHDEAELVRLAYVATTRARELLVVPTVGEGKLEGWIELLAPAVYPAASTRRSPQQAVGVPTFGGDSLASRPIELPHGAEASVAPGEHVPMAGDHRVVWWDPCVLDLTRRPPGGISQRELLRADGAEPAREGEGLSEYAAFREARALARARGAQPSLETRAITQLAAQGAFSGPPLRPVEVLDSGVERAGRPAGPRFGALVHALLEHATLDGDGADLEPLAAFVGRSIGATDDERARAVSDVRHALAHPLLGRVRAAEARGWVFREWPVTVCSEAGKLREGTVDLAFREAEGGTTRIVLVDFKTDLALADELTVYARQLSLYADALERALSEPVSCLLFRV